MARLNTVVSVEVTTAKSLQPQEQDIRGNQGQYTMSTQPDEDELRELMSNRKRVRRESIEHYLDNEDELREQFGGHAIAIADSKVVHSIETADDAEEVLAFIDRIRSGYAAHTSLKSPNRIK